MNETKPRSHEPLNSYPNSPPATIAPQVYRIELCLGKGTHYSVLVFFPVGLLAEFVCFLVSREQDQHLLVVLISSVFSPPITGRHWKAIPESDKFEATTRSRSRIQPPASVHASSPATSNQHARLIPSLGS